MWTNVDDVDRFACCVLRASLARKTNSESCACLVSPHLCHCVTVDCVALSVGSGPRWVGPCFRRWQFGVLAFPSLAEISTTSDGVAITSSASPCQSSPPPPTTRTSPTGELVALVPGVWRVSQRIFIDSRLFCTPRRPVDCGAPPSSGLDLVTITITITTELAPSRRTEPARHTAPKPLPTLLPTSLRIH